MDKRVQSRLSAAVVLALSCLQFGINGCAVSTERYPFPSQDIDLEIVFSAHYRELIYMHVGGGEAVGLGPSETVIVGPRFSRDGEKVAYYDLGANQLPVSSTAVTLKIQPLKGMESGALDLFVIPMPWFDIDNRFVVDEILPLLWEPEGNSVLIAHGRGIDRVTTSGVRSQLVTGYGVRAITLSPSGDTIAFTTRENVFFLDRRRGAPEAVLAPDFVPQFGNKDVRGVAFSSDGDRLAFSVGNMLYIMDIRSGAVGEVCKADWRIYWLDWLPDGQRLVYLTGRELERSAMSFNRISGIEPRYYLISTDLGGKDQRLLFTERQVDVRRAMPDLSPDGQFICVTGGGWQWREVFIVGTERSAVYQLTASGLNGYASWRPLPAIESP